MVLGVREGNLYRLRGHPMSVVASRSRETDEEEQVAPRVVRQVTPPVVQAQREPEFRGSQPSGSRREEKPPRTMQRIMDREKMAPGLCRLRGSQVSGGACDLRVSLISGRVSWLRGRDGHPEGVPPQVQLGERHLPGLTDRCHGLRRPDKSFKVGGF
jgi:hypothetical protein